MTLPLLLICAAPVPARGEARLLRGAALDISRLDNGLTVILHRDPAAPRVSVDLVYRAGSSHETPGKTGIAHLLEHLMFEGSAHVPPGAFDAWLREAGGEANAATGEDATFYWQDVPPGALERALFLESDRMGFLAGIVEEGVLGRQKQVIAREREYIEESSPSTAEEWITRPALFPEGHPYHHPVIGRSEDLPGLAVDDVLEFHAEHYRPSNASLVVAGAIDIDATRALVGKWFSEIPGESPGQVPRPAPPTPREQRRIVRESALPVSRLSARWPSAPAFSRDHAALAVLADLLAGGPGSRLREALVEERGLAVAVSAKQEGLRLGGVFTIEVEAAPGRPLGPVLRELDRVIAGLVRGGPTRTEVRRSSAGLATRLLGEVEQPGGFRGLAYRLNESWAYTGDPGRYAEEVSHLRSMRPADIRRAAARWLGAVRVVLSTVPNDRRDLAAGAENGE